MSREAEFLFYRDHIGDTINRLVEIQKSAWAMRIVKIDVDPAVKDGWYDMPYTDSRHDAACMEEEIEAWFTPKGPKMLFEAQTLAAISTEGAVCTQSSNIAHHVENILKITTAYSPMDAGGMISFSGFTDSEVARIINSTKSRAEKLLETLRTIRTECHYLQTARLKPNRTYSKPIPDEGYMPFPGGRTKVESYDYPLVFTKYWFELFVGPEQAQSIMDNFERIITASEARPGEPPALRYYSSNETNRISVNYVAD